MKKRKNIILSAITCFVSICMLMFGVYSASNPSVTIGGQVSYTARDASVLVQGVTDNTGASTLTYSKTAPTNKTALLALDKTSDKINKSASDSAPAEYFDWTQGEKSGNSTDANETLSTWDISTISFKEDTSGIKPIKLGYKFTNYSNYPVTATITFDKSLTEMTSANVTRTISGETNKVVTVEMGVVGSANATQEIVVTYEVKDDSKGVNATGLLGMNIAFEKDEPRAKLVVEYEVPTMFSHSHGFTLTANGTECDASQIPLNCKLVIEFWWRQDCGPTGGDWQKSIVVKNLDGTTMDSSKYTNTEEITTAYTMSDICSTCTFTFEAFEGASIYVPSPV